MYGHPAWVSEFIIIRQSYLHNVHTKQKELYSTSVDMLRSVFKKLLPANKKKAVMELAVAANS